MENSTTWKTRVSVVLLLAGIIGGGFTGGYVSARGRFAEDTNGRINLTLGDFVPGETPCQEDEIFDHVTIRCIHRDDIYSETSSLSYLEECVRIEHVWKDGTTEINEYGPGC